MAERERSRSNTRASGGGGRPSAGPSRATAGGGDRGAGAGGGGRPPGEEPSGGARLRKPLWTLAGAAAVAVAVAAGAFFALDGPVSDTDADSQARRQAYEQFKAAGGMGLEMVAPEDVDRAIESIPEPQAREQIREDVQQGRVQLAWLTLRDTHAEDGDVLRFETKGVAPVEVMALNTPTTLAIPYPVDGKVFVTGVTDGGGGITIELKSGATQIAWPTMRVGDTLELPVTPVY